MDMVGPKYLSGGFKLYFLNIIDTENHFAGVYPMKDKSSQSVATALIQFWSTYGMPDYLQIDNELSFRGSNRHPRSLGVVLRLSLSLGITPIFIPPAEPWRNGIVEKFNHNMLKYFFSKDKFISFEQLKTKAFEFSSFHNNNHRYSSQGGKSACMIKSTSQEYVLREQVDITKPIPLISGEIIFIRFIRSDRNINILGSKFTVKQELVYNYVVAVVSIENHVLLIKQNNIVQHCFPFVMPVD